MAYLEDKFALEAHSDHYRHSEFSHLYCENTYCEDYTPWTPGPDGNGYEIENGTALESISHQQCMDMCLCDEDCMVFYWGEYECVDPADNSQIPCRMCRIFHSFADETEPFCYFGSCLNPFRGFSFIGDVRSTFSGSKNGTNFDDFGGSHINYFTGTPAMENVDNDTCVDCIMLQNCTENESSNG